MTAKPGNLPPNLQQVAQGVNNIVQPAARVPVIDNVVPVLAFTIPSGQIVRRVFWSVDQFTLTGANTQLVFTWPEVPQSETRRYLHIWIDEPRVDPVINLRVVYPAQGVLTENVGGVIARADAGGDGLDFLSPGQGADKIIYPGLPVDVFPSGRLNGQTDQPLAAGDTVKVFSVWERLAPPNTARAELDPLTFVEF